MIEIKANDLVEPKSYSKISRASRCGAILMCLSLTVEALSAQERDLLTEIPMVGFEVEESPERYFGTVRATELMNLSYEADGCIIDVARGAIRERKANGGEFLAGLNAGRADLALQHAAARVAELEAMVEENRVIVEVSRSEEVRGRSDLELAEKEYHRIETMFERGLVNESVMNTAARGYLQAVFTVERAQEAVEKAIAAKSRADIALRMGRLDLQTAELDRSELVLLAPIDGLLVAFEPKVGECVEEGSFAGHIYAPRLKSVDVLVRISRLTAEIGDVPSIGTVVRVSRVNGEVCGGTIAGIDNSAETETQFVEVSVEIEEDCALNLYLNESVEVKGMHGQFEGTQTESNYVISNKSMAMDDY